MELQITAEVLLDTVEKYDQLENKAYNIWIKYRDLLKEKESRVTYYNSQIEFTFDTTHDRVEVMAYDRDGDFVSGRFPLSWMYLTDDEFADVIKSEARKCEEARTALQQKDLEVQRERQQATLRELIAIHGVPPDIADRIKNS